MNLAAGGKSKLFLALIVLLFCAAPTPGDIGGCGQAAEALDARVFFASKASIDCDRCGECGLNTETCQRACDRRAARPTSFPDRCLPLVHDGEVCLRALLHASCTDYTRFVNDADPRVPSECDFCPGQPP